MKRLRSKTRPCDEYARNVAAYVEGLLPQGSCDDLELHASRCGACTREIQTQQEVRTAVQLVPQRVPPPELKTKLQVLASREISRRRSTETFEDLLETWCDRARLTIQNLMRPLAIPTAGGFLSALVLFSILAPVLAVPPVTVSAESHDTPILLYTEASLKSVKPLGLQDQDVMVELSIDGNGRIVDYCIPENPASVYKPSIRRSIENHLLFTQFTPATTFGHPTSTKVRITFRSSSIDVKG